MLHKILKKITAVKDAILHQEEIDTRIEGLSKKVLRLVARNTQIQEKAHRFAQDLIQEAPSESDAHVGAAEWLFREYGLRCGCGSCFGDPPN